MKSMKLILSQLESSPLRGAPYKWYSWIDVYLDLRQIYGKFRPIQTLGAI